MEILAPDSHSSVGKYNLYTGKRVSNSTGQAIKSATGKKSKSKKESLEPANSNSSGTTKQKSTAGDVGLGAERLILVELKEFVEKSKLKPFTHHVSCILGFGIEPLVYTPDSLATGLTQTQATGTPAHGLSSQGGNHSEGLREQQVTQLSEGAVLMLLKSTVLWCSRGGSNGGGGSSGYQENTQNSLLLKLHSLCHHGVFRGLRILVKRIQCMLLQRGRGASSGRDGSLLESSEVPVERDLHMRGSKVIPVEVEQFAILEQIVCLYGEVLNNKDIQDDLISTGKAFDVRTQRDRNIASDAFHVPLIIRVSLDLSSLSNDNIEVTPAILHTVKDLAVCYEGALRGAFDTFHALVLGLLKHRVFARSSALGIEDDDTYIAFEDAAETEDGSNSLFKIPGFDGCEGGRGDTKALNSRNDKYMLHVVSICHILDTVLDLSAQFLLTLDSGRGDKNCVATVLSELLAPAALPLQFSDLCKSILQYDWANSRMKEGGGGEGYTYTSKDLSFFVQMSLKHASDPLEKIQFMVNELFLDELKVNFMKNAIMMLLNSSVYVAACDTCRLLCRSCNPGTHPTHFPP